VATLLDDAGLTARQIADILGHSRSSMTQDVYMGPRIVSRVGAEALHGVLGKGDE
jgi:integrase